MQSRQRVCLDYLTRYQRASGGISPTVREISAVLDARGMAVVLKVLDDLEAGGFIRRWPNGRRRIQLLKPYTAYDEGNAEFFVWDSVHKRLVRRRVGSDHA